MAAISFYFDKILQSPFAHKRYVQYTRGQNPMNFVPIFHHRNIFSMGRSKHCSNEACGLTVVVNS